MNMWKTTLDLYLQVINEMYSILYYILIPVFNTGNLNISYTGKGYFVN